MVETFNINSFLGEHDQPVFIINEKCENCETDCKRYRDLLDQSLRLRVEKKQIQLDVGGGAKNISLNFYNGDYAVMDLNESDSQYRKKIGDASWSIINRAKRSGMLFDSDLLVEETKDQINSVLTSKLIRSGREIPKEWLSPDYLLPVWKRNLCSAHCEKLFVVKLNNKIIALATMRFFGNLAAFNFIVGHADYLKHGVMYFLIYNIRIYLRSRRPEIDYLYYMWMGRPDYAKYYYFKKGVGFEKKPMCIVSNHIDLKLLENLCKRNAHKQHSVETRKTAIKKPKLFGVVTRLPNSEEFLFEFGTLLKKLIPNNANLVKFASESASFLSDFSGSAHVNCIHGLCTQKRISVISAESDIVTIDCTLVRASDFFTFLKSSFNVFYLGFDRGSVVVLFIRKETDALLSVEVLKNSFKNSAFQVFDCIEVELRGTDFFVVLLVHL